MSSSSFILALYALLGVIATFIVATMVLPLPYGNGLELFGQIDFQSYWCAASLFWNGENPYLSSAYHSISGCPAALIWNPPQMFIFLWPLSLFSLEIATYILLAIQFAAYWYLLFYSLRLVSNVILKVSALLIANVIILLALLNIPVIYCLQFGQWSLILSVALLALQAALNRHYYLLTGLLLSFIAIKPQALIFILALWGWRFVFTSSAKGIFVVCLTFILVLLAPYLINSNATYFWFTEKPIPVAWIDHSLLAIVIENSFIKELLIKKALVLLAVFFSLVLAGGIAWWSERNEVPRYELSPYVIVISSILMPYGYLFDLTLLTIPLCVLLIAIFRNSLKE